MAIIRDGTTTMTKISIIGAGAWGTALAAAAAQAGNAVKLIGIEKDVIESINAKHENTQRLPGVPLPKNIKASIRFSSIREANLVILAQPAQATRAVLRRIKKDLNPDTYLIIGSKGIELGTQKLLSEVLQEEVPDQPFAVLSGPAFAKPLAQGFPTACTLASANLTAGRWLASTLSYKNFRIYPCEDVIGTQLGGALKNVIAIAVGICDGMGFSENTRAMLMTRGLHEMCRFGVTFGAREATFMGLSGLGDLALTCSSSSRNYAFGYAIGKGESIDHLLNDQNTTREGAQTALAAEARAHSHDIDIPIISGVCSIIERRAKIQDVIEGLLDRPIRSEERV